jgi:hypothetical protein
LRVWWALGGAPDFPPIGTDLVAFTGWWSVVVCGAAAAVVLGLRQATWRWPLLVAAWGVSVALVAACAPLLLDIVGLLLPGLGVPFHLVAFLSRAACLAGGVLVGATALSYILFGRASLWQVHPVGASCLAVVAAVTLGGRVLRPRRSGPSPLR